MVHVNHLEIRLLHRVTKTRIFHRQSSKQLLETLIYLFLFVFLQKFFQKWTTRATTKDRTSALRHQTTWTIAAPRTSPSWPRPTWRTWRSITILGRIRAATLHLEWARPGNSSWFFPFFLFFCFLSLSLSFLGRLRGKLQSCFQGFGRRHWGLGEEGGGEGAFHLALASFQLEPEAPGRTPGRRRSSEETFLPRHRHWNLFGRLVSGAPLFPPGFTELADSTDSLAGGQSNLYVVCTY